MTKKKSYQTLDFFVFHIVYINHFELIITIQMLNNLLKWKLPLHTLMQCLETNTQ